MAINFNLPATTRLYATEFVPDITNAFKALGQMLDPAYAGTLTNTPTGAKRISSGLFEQFNGTAWSELSMGYLKKTGDTGSGALTMNNFIAAASGGTAGEFRFTDRNADATYGSWYRNAGVNRLFDTVHNGDLFAVGPNTFTYKGNNVYHAGNFNPATYAPLASPGFSGTVSTTGAEIAAGSGQNEEKRLRMHNANRNVYFYLNGTQAGLYDVTGVFSRWYTDASGNMVVYAGLSVNNGANGVWHSGNFTPSNYAQLTGATFTSSINVTPTSSGSVGLAGGSASNPGYVEFRTAEGTRRGYMGWGNGASRMQFVAENGWAWEFSGAVNFTTIPQTGGVNLITTPIGSWTGNMSVTGSAGIAMTLQAAGANVGLRVIGGTGQDVAIFEGGTSQDAIVKIIGNGTTNAYLLMMNGTNGERVRAYADNSRNFVVSTNSGATNSMLLDSSHNLTAAGNVTAYSDERLKKDFRPARVSLADMLSLDPETYARIDIRGTRQAGVRAQTMRRVLPEAVIADEKGLLSINYGAAAMVMVLNLAREVAALRTAQ